MSVTIVRIPRISQLRRRIESGLNLRLIFKNTSNFFVYQLFEINVKNNSNFFVYQLLTSSLGNLLI